MTARTMRACGLAATGRGMLVAALALAFMAGSGWLVATTIWRPEPSADAVAMARPVLDRTSLLALVDHDGRKLRAAALEKLATIVFFGYTHCPDVCPMELATMAAALDRLGPAASEVGAFFVSVDPERDTPAHLAGYVGLFHPGIVGLTGTAEAVAGAAAAFRAPFARVEEADGDYGIDHFARTLVLDREGRLVAAVPFASPAETLAAAIRPLLEDGT